MLDLDIRCTECGRYLNLKGIISIISQVRCPDSRCKHLNNVKVVNSQSSEEDIRYNFPETPSDII